MTPGLRALAALAIGALLLPGCAYNYTFRTGLPKMADPIEQTKHIELWGWLSDDEPFDLEAACPSGVAEFGSYVSFLDWLPSFFTIGIYAPRTIYAYCADTKAEAHP
jgi:hypothetical protein